MTFAKPEAGLVIRYEAEAGSDEGRKDRPCGVVLARADAGGRTWAYVLPITHTKPAVLAIEIPSVVNARLGLDADRSWIVLTEANLFVWPVQTCGLFLARSRVIHPMDFFRRAFFGTFGRIFSTRMPRAR